MKRPVAPAITDDVLIGLETIATNGLLVEHLEGSIDVDYVKDLEVYKKLKYVKAARKFVEKRRKYVTDMEAYLEATREN